MEEEHEQQKLQSDIGAPESTTPNNNYNNGISERQEPNSDILNLIQLTENETRSDNRNSNNKEDEMLNKYKLFNVGASSTFYQQTVFHKASEEGDVQFLQQHRSKIDGKAKNSFNETLLHVAKDAQTVQFLLSNFDFDITKDQDINGNTALHVYAMRGDVDALQLIMDSNPNVAQQIRTCFSEMRNQFEEDPLHVACKYGHLNAVRYLVENVVTHKNEPAPVEVHLSLDHFMNLGPNPITQYLQLAPKRAFEYVAGTSLNDMQLSESIFQYIVEPYKPLKYAASPLEATETPLHLMLYSQEAAAAADEELHARVAELIQEIPPAQRKAVLNATNGYGETALHLLLSRPKKVYALNQIVELLMTHGADANIANKFGCTPLYYAVKNYGEEDITTTTLFKFGAVIGSMRQDMTWYAKPQRRKRYFISYLHTACEGGSPAVVSYLLAKGYTNSCDLTPLHIACINGSLPIVKLLVERGGGGKGAADLNAIARVNQVTWATRKSKFGESLKPAFLAARMGHYDIVEYLHSQSPDAIQGHQTQEDVSILTMACHGSDEDPEHTAARVRLIRFLLQHGINDSVLGKRTLTSPMIACYYGNKQVLDTLLRSGGDFRLSVSSLSNQVNCMHLACLSGHQRFIEELAADRGPLVVKLLNRATKWGVRPVHMATAALHSPKLVEYLHKQFKVMLVASTADTILRRSANTKRGITVLHYACCFRNAEAVRYLLGPIGMNPNCECMDHVEPLHVAVAVQDLEISKMLLDASDRSTVGMHTVSQACDTNNRELAALIMSTGVRPVGRVYLDSEMYHQLSLGSPVDAARSNAPPTQEAEYSTEIHKRVDVMVKKRWTAGIGLYAKFIAGVVVPLILNFYFIIYNFYIYAVLKRVPEEASGLDMGGFLKVTRVVVCYFELIVQCIIVVIAILLVVTASLQGYLSSRRGRTVTRAHATLFSLVSSTLMNASFSVTRFVFSKDTILMYIGTIFNTLKMVFEIKIHYMLNMAFKCLDTYSVMRDFESARASARYFVVHILIAVVITPLVFLLILVVIIAVLLVLSAVMLVLYLLGVLAILIKMKQMTFIYTAYFPWSSSPSDVLLYFSFIAFVNQMLSIVKPEWRNRAIAGRLLGYDKSTLWDVIYQKLYEHRYSFHVIMILSTWSMDTDIELATTCVKHRYHFLANQEPPKTKVSG